MAITSNRDQRDDWERDLRRLRQQYDTYFDQLLGQRYPRPSGDEDERYEGPYGVAPSTRERYEGL